MAIDFKCPELGEGVESGTVASLLVSEGDTIEADQPIMEVDMEKATAPVPCPHAGKITKLHVAEGDEIAVGQVICTVEAGEAGLSSTNGAEPAKAEGKPQEAAAGGEAKSGGSATAVAEKPAKPHEASHETADAQLRPTVQARPGQVVPAGPAARRLARLMNIDLSQVSGSAAGGRITPDDVVAYGERKKPAGGQLVPQGGGGVPAVAEDVGQPEKYGPVKVEKLSGIRKAIANAMTRSKTIIPHLTNFDDADVTDLERLRRSVDPNRIGSNVKLTSMPFVIKATALALRERPMMNASIDVAGGRLIYKDYVHIGIAVDTDRGLVVPVLRDVDKMSIPEIARSLKSLAERARGGQFTPEDTRGGTFTISNLGAIGGQYSTPVINYPEVGILLLGRTQKRPVVMENDSLEVRQLMPLSLSYDHRLIDGAEAARFLNVIKAYLEKPGDLLLAGG